MEKIVLFTFVFLAAVAMICADNATSVATSTTSMAPTASQTAAASNESTPEPSTTPAVQPTTTAASAIQPLAMFVLLCAFLGLLH